MTDIQSSKKRITYQVNINTTHYVAGTNAYKVTFPSTVDVSKNNAKLGVFQYSMYNSTFNISDKLGNNTYKIIWVDGVTYDIKIEDGYYSFSDLNQNLQYNMAKHKLYLQNSTNSSQVMYFIGCLANSIQYTAQIDVLYVPSTLPNGYVIPNGANWSLPSTAKYPQLVLSSGLMKMFGFKQQSVFPSSSSTANGLTNLSFLSETYPILSPVFTYIIGCNLMNSPYSNLSTQFFAIPLTAGFGSLIHETMGSYALLDVSPGIYSNIVITLHDQEFNPIIPEDPELSLSLIFQHDV